MFSATSSGSFAMSGRVANMCTISHHSHVRDQRHRQQDEEVERKPAKVGLGSIGLDRLILITYLRLFDA